MAIISSMFFLSNAFGVEKNFDLIKRDLKLDLHNHDIVVAFILSSNCPCTGRILSILKRIDSVYSRSPDWKVIYLDENPNRQTSLISKTLRRPVRLDADHKIADALGAKVTPEVRVWRADGDLVYSGAIDREGQSKEGSPLEEAMKSIEQGKKVTVNYVEPFGCAIREEFIDAP